MIGPEPSRPPGLPRPRAVVERRAEASGRSSLDASGRKALEAPERTPLEAPFAYLAAQGAVAPGVYLAAEARARRIGVGVDDVLIASGALDDAALARGFARRWRLPFVAAPRLDAFNGPGAALCGVASLEEAGGGPRFAVAPRGVRAQALARALRRPGAPPDGRLGVAPAAALRAAALSTLAPRLAREASTTLPDALAARLAAPTPEQAGAAALVFLICLVALAAVGAAGSLAALAVGAVFLIAVVSRLAAVLASRDEPPCAAPLDDADLPRYAVVVAMYREEAVVADLVAALDRLDYPHEKLSVSLVVEEDDAPTRAALDRLTLPPQMEVIVVAPGRPRTKPRALNVALAACDADLFVIYDAEDRPDPDQLRKAAARFAAAPAHVACVQARLAIDNAHETLISRLFALDYAGLFEVANPGFAALDWPMLLGGTSNHFRVGALRAVGGWDAWNVTEDADLGLRLARAGYGVDTIRSVTWEEAPVTLRAWLAQRRRWLKGWMQTGLVHTRAPRALWRELGPDRLLAVVGTLGGGLLSAVFGPLFAARVVLDLAAGRLVRVDSALDVAVSALTLTLVAFGLACAILPPLIGARRAGYRGLAGFVVLLPFYYLLISWASWRALIELTHAPHVWAKTLHGVSRRRAGQSLEGLHLQGCVSASAR